METQYKVNCFCLFSKEEGKIISLVIDKDNQDFIYDVLDRARQHFQQSISRIDLDREFCSENFHIMM